MSKTYKVQDTQTGKVITFSWDGPGEPTDDDYEQIFAEAKFFKPEPSMGEKGWGLYEKAIGLPKAAADKLAGLVTSPFMETPLSAGQLAQATSPQGIAEGIAGLIPGLEGLKAGHEARMAQSRKDYPRLHAALDQGNKMVESFRGDPMTYLPFVGGPKVAAAFAPAMAKGVYDADVALGDTIIKEGWSPNAVRQLVDAAGSSAFAVLLLKSFSKKADPVKSVEEAFEKTKAEVGKKGIEPDIETQFEIAREGEGLQPPPTPVSDIEARFAAAKEKVGGELPTQDNLLASQLEDALRGVKAAKPPKKGRKKESGSIDLEILLPEWLRGKKEVKSLPEEELLALEDEAARRGDPLHPEERMYQESRAREIAERRLPAHERRLEDVPFEGQERRQGQRRGSAAELLDQDLAAPPLADQPVGSDPEAGFIRIPSSQDVKDFVKGTTDLARASVAGQAGVATRNTISGWRQIIEAPLTNIAAAAQAKMKAGFLRRMGQQRKAAGYDEAAKYFTEVSQAYGGASWRGALDTFADAFQYIRNKGKLNPSGRFAESLDLLKDTGNAPLAKRLESFSDPTFSAAGKIRKGMMFFSILGDRFINRTFLDAYSSGLMKHYGKKSIPELLQHLQNDPHAMDFARDSLAEATGEAFRASWQQMSPEKSPLRSIVSYLETKPIGNILAMVTNPFPRALLSNLLPNMIEKTPFFRLSPRVKNSYRHFELRGQREILKERIAAAKAQGQLVQKADVDLLRKTQSEMRGLEKDTIYHPSMIAARASLGTLVAGAFAIRRFLSGDDKTEFDELKVPGTERVASLTSQLGEDLPFAFAGDILGHLMLSEKNGTPFKYASKEGVVKVGDLGRALYGSRYGMPTPGLDLAGELAGAILGKGGGEPEVKVEYLKRLTSGVLEGIGRMYGAGAWVGEGARVGAELSTPEEALVRRTDIGPLPEAPLRGFQSQVPGWRQELPPSPRWSKLAPGAHEFPLASLTGYEQTLSPLEEFMRDNRIDPGDVLPRRSDDPQFDMMYLERFKQLVERNVLSRVPRTESMSLAGRQSWFESQMKKQRSAAKKLAENDYRKATGRAAPSVSKERQEKLKKRQLKRESRLPPQP